MVSRRGGADVPSQRSQLSESSYAAFHQAMVITLKIDLEDIPIPDLEPTENTLIPDIDEPQNPLASILQENSTCIARSAARPILALPDAHINAWVQFLRDHALTGKFMGFWPIEQSLRGWIATKWKPKSHFDLQLGSKGFFTIIFHHLEDKTKVEEGGPYFFNSARLYLKNYTKKFFLEKEDFTRAPV